MSIIEKIENLLVEQDLTLIGRVTANNDEENRYFAFVRAKYNTSGKRTPSTRALNKISNIFKKDGVSVSFVVIDENRDDLEHSLKTMLFNKFPDQIKNSFASISNAKANVWIEPKGPLSESEAESISKSVDNFCDLLEIEPKSKNFVSVENIPMPTTTAVLRTMRIIAPCNVQSLTEALVNEKFKVPDEPWVNHILDRMRKAELIVRRKDGQYFLSLKGLSALGSQRDGSSPDISRALAQARRIV